MFGAEQESADDVVAYDGSVNLVLMGVVVGYFGLLILVGIVHCIRSGG